MLTIVKETIREIASRLGYVVIPKWRLPNWEFATHLRKIFKIYEIMTVVDVGANEGQYGEFLRREVGFKGLIISVEPQVKCFQELQKKAFKDPKWAALNTAFGAIEEIREFNVMQGTVFSSFLEPNMQLPGNTVTERVAMRVRTLDSVIKEIEALRRIGPIYLKLDTQGFDLEVMKGASASFRQIRALQTEVSVLPIYDNMICWHDAIQTFGDCGFAVSGLWPVVHTSRLEVIEFDCVMVRRN